MNTAWAAWSLICVALMANGARNRYNIYGWKDKWFGIFLVGTVYNAVGFWLFLTH